MTLLAAILEALGKRKRRILDDMEHSLPPPLFPPMRRRVLRELGKDELEQDIENIIKQYAERHGKGRWK